MIRGHGKGAPAPSIHDHKPALQGVRAMALRHADTELLTAGADGKVIVWDITSGLPERQVKTIEVRAAGTVPPAQNNNCGTMQ